MGRGGRRSNSGRKAGYESSLRKFKEKTKVARIPESLNIENLIQFKEMIAAKLEEWEAKDKGNPSKRTKEIKAIYDFNFDIKYWTEENND